MDANRNHIQVIAEQDAQSDTNKLLWFIAGLVLNVIGIVVAYFYESSPLSTRLLAKSDEEVLIYTEVYKAKARKIQLISALVGFILIPILVVPFVVTLFSLFF
ncbi:MAG: hypothetical protein OXI43_04540 [Candidatus Poribacteria bacterium]|nr:hypothetical protein [Candidatus Poribacteria bacterium]